MTLPVEQLLPIREDAEALNAAGIASTDDFWERLAAKPDFLSDIFQDTAARARVLSAMTRDGVEESKELASPLLRRHLPDFVVIALVSLLVYGVARHRGPGDPNGVRQVVVSAQDGLPPYHLITARDVSLQARPIAADSVASLNEVIGRYSSQFLGGGAVIRRASLSRGPALAEETPPRKVFQLTVRPTALLTGIVPPLKITLIGAPRETDAKGRVFDDIVLLSASMATDGVVAVVAAPAKDAAEFASLLGMSDFVVALPGGSP